MKRALSHCSEADLIILLKTGQEAALAELFTRFEVRLHNYIMAFTRNLEMAEEVLQDVFVNLWEYREHIDETLPINALLYKITRNTMLNAIRQEVRLQRQRKTYSLSMEVSRDLTEEKVLFNDYQRIMDIAIENLPQQRRSIFCMNLLEGKSYDEIAEALGISKNTVRNQMVKSLKYVRNYLNTCAGVDMPLIITIVFLSR